MKTTSLAVTGLLSAEAHRIFVFRLLYFFVSPSIQRNQGESGELYPIARKMVTPGITALDLLLGASALAGLIIVRFYYLPGKPK